MTALVVFNVAVAVWLFATDRKDPFSMFCAGWCMCAALALAAI